MTREDLGKLSEPELRAAIEEMERQGLQNTKHLLVLGDVSDTVAWTFMQVTGQAADESEYYVAIVELEGFRNFIKEAVSIDMVSLDVVKDAAIGETHIVILGDGGMTHYSVFQDSTVN